MYEECFSNISKIKKLENYSLFYDLKKTLSQIILRKRTNKNKINDLVKQDFFRLVHNGRVVILPFMCNGNNQVQISGN